MKQADLYDKLSLDDKLALLNLVEKAVRGTDGSPREALLAADKVLLDLNVLVTLSQIGQRLRLCLDCSLRDLHIAYYDMERENERTFFRLCRPEI